ncbi:MAG: glycosyltransferase family 1 protein [bacterium]|nr:glycosyltransferase family 1 protein [bacterium]
MTKPNIALMGSRGIPACYGGFETLFEELAPRLVELGFDVTVYCRSRYTARDCRKFKGVRLVRLPSLYAKYTETPVHTALSCLHAITRGYDAALMVNGANAIFVPWLELRGTPVALNVDGIEKQRAKWGRVGRAVYAISEFLAVTLPARLVTDAKVIESHYRRHYGASSATIAYGVEPRPLPAGPTLAELGLRPREYFLYVSRFEPENNPHRVTEAYRAVGGGLPLVMVGDAPYSRNFIADLKARSDSRVLFPGAIYGDGYRELLSGALAFVQATEVGGTHPALVEAMGYGNCVVVNDTPENREVAGDTALYFRADRPATLTEQLERIRRNPDPFEWLRAAAARRARTRYSWERVARRYAALLSDMTGRAHL